VYFENESAILSRMQGNVPSDIDTTEGSFVYDALSPISLEIAQQEVNLDEVLKRVFATTAAANGYSDELEERAAEFGVARKAGTNATVIMQITGTDGTYTGVTVQTAAGLQYVIPSVTVAGGTGTATATAADIGAAYNVPVGAITVFPVQISGLTAATNTTAATGGTDIESDADLLARFLITVQTPSTSGNVGDYKLWALAISGVGKVKVFPLWNGNSTVKVCLIDSNMQPLSSTLVTAVQTYVESVRPIGAMVTYEAATGLSINVSATLILATGYTVSGVTAAIEAAITAYLQSIAFLQDYVSLGRIGNAILSVTGVGDYSNLTVNSGTANVSVGTEQVAILGVTTLS
jgi:uncharacterized phage protein gp47/JayE